MAGKEKQKVKTNVKTKKTGSKRGSYRDANIQEVKHLNMKITLKESKVNEKCIDELTKTK